MTNSYRNLFSLFASFKAFNGVDLSPEALVAVARNMTIIRARLETCYAERAEIANRFSKDDPEHGAKLSAAIETLMAAEIEMPKLHTVKLSGLLMGSNPKIQPGILSDLITEGYVIDDLPNSTQEVK